MRLEELLVEIVRGVLTDASAPPQIVGLPSSPARIKDVVVRLDADTFDVLAEVGKTFGVTPERMARVLLNASAAYMVRSTQGRDPAELYDAFWERVGVR